MGRERDRKNLEKSIRKHSSTLTILFCPLRLYSKETGFKLLLICTLIRREKAADGNTKLTRRFFSRVVLIVRTQLPAKSCCHCENTFRVV